MKDDIKHVKDDIKHFGDDHPKVKHFVEDLPHMHKPHLPANLEEMFHHDCNDHYKANIDLNALDGSQVRELITPFHVK